MAETRARRRISRRTLRSATAVEQYLRAGVVPRFIERANQIESGTRRELARLERVYESARRRFAGDRDGFADHWHALARRWRFGELNDLIDEHNRWYPVERRLPLNPRTGDYITIGNRPWRRRSLDAAWILERFPPTL